MIVGVFGGGFQFEKRTGMPTVIVKGKNEKKLFRRKKGCKRKKKGKNVALGEIKNGRIRKIGQTNLIGTRVDDREGVTMQNNGPIRKQYGGKDDGITCQRRRYKTKVLILLIPYKLMLYCVRERLKIGKILNIEFIMKSQRIHNSYRSICRNKL